MFGLETRLDLLLHFLRGLRDRQTADTSLALVSIDVSLIGLDLNCQRRIDRDWCGRMQERAGESELVVTEEEEDVVTDEATDETDAFVAGEFVVG